MTQLSSGLGATSAICRYVFKWPFRHIFGSHWLRAEFGTYLEKVGTDAIADTYGLRFTTPERPPVVADLPFVTIMQITSAVLLLAFAWYAYALTGDWIAPAFVLIGFFLLIPSKDDFLTEGDMADRMPAWTKPISGLLSFLCSLPAWIPAIPISLIWGLIGTFKSSGRTRP